VFSDELAKLRSSCLYREILDRGPGGSTSRILIGGKELISFASNDYLGLSHDPRPAEAARMAAEAYGFGAGSSRLLSGGTELHGQLEEAIAGFKGTEKALCLNSGYTANVTAIPALAGAGDMIFSDELNHASIIDGCRLSRAQTVIYRHREWEQLSALMKEHQGRKTMVVTDTVFSMDGDIAPLREINELCRTHRALFYLDDAHGTGVLAEGKGALAHAGLQPEPHIIQMGTFSKALGSFGGFIAAEERIIQWLVNTGRGFIYSTALPAPVVAASLKALRIIMDDPSVVKGLWRKRAMLMEGISNLGFETLSTESPIIPLVLPEQRENPGDPTVTIAFSRRLRDLGLYAPCIRPPTVRLPMIRISVTAAHREEDIRALLQGLSFAK
jgi:8-amino-7-oxononanoate synthase